MFPYSVYGAWQLAKDHREDLARSMHVARRRRSDRTRVRRDAPRPPTR